MKEIWPMIPLLIIVNPIIRHKAKMAKNFLSNLLQLIQQWKLLTIGYGKITFKCTAFSQNDVIDTNKDICF